MTYNKTLSLILIEFRVNFDWIVDLFLNLVFSYDFFSISLPKKTLGNILEKHLAHRIKSWLKAVMGIVPKRTQSNHD